MALQYGNPVTFRQALYRSYFVQRPEVPVEVLGRILPGVDVRSAPVVAMAASPAPPSAPRSAAAGNLAAAEVARAPAPVMAAPAEAAAATEGAQETVFALPSPVTLAAGHTATLPILDREATARRIGLAQQGRPHPLASIRLTNDTATSLPAGVLTLYDPASPAMFAGDARLGGLPAEESRLLSFAEDLRTAVVWKQDDAASLAAVTAAQGVLRIDERQRTTTQVVVTAPAGEGRELLIEILKRPTATLVPDPALSPAEETAGAWRFAVSLKAGEARGTRCGRTGSRGRALRCWRARRRWRGCSGCRGWWSCGRRGRRRWNGSARRARRSSGTRSGSGGIWGPCRRTMHCMGGCCSSWKRRRRGWRGCGRARRGRGRLWRRRSGRWRWRWRGLRCRKGRSSFSVEKEAKRHLSVWPGAGG